MPDFLAATLASFIPAEVYGNFFFPTCGILLSFFSGCSHVINKIRVRATRLFSPCFCSSLLRRGKRSRFFFRVCLFPNRLLFHVGNDNTTCYASSHKFISRMAVSLLQVTGHFTPGNWGRCFLQSDKTVMYPLVLLCKRNKQR